MQMESFVVVIVSVITVVVVVVVAASDVDDDDDDFLDSEGALFHLGRLQREERARELIW